jgi:hypothetical protein
MGAIDQPHRTTPMELAVSPIRYNPDPGDMIIAQDHQANVLYESQSLVHDGKLPALRILEDKINRQQNGTGTLSETSGDETYSITLAHGKRVEAGVLREDHSADVARYNADGSVDETIMTELGSTHQHFGSDGKLHSEEHEMTLNDGRHSADHLEYDHSGQMLSSDIRVLDPKTGEVDSIHDHALPDGGGLRIEKSPSGDSVVMTKPDGSSVLDSVLPDGTKVHQETDAAGNTLFTDTTNPQTGVITHAVPKPDGTAMRLEQRKL